MIDILLATYNSEKYLHEQIQSILNQDFSDWRLLIRDGGSSDSTLNIITDYVSKFPEKIVQIPSCAGAGAMENFWELLKSATAEYIMFSDHDDVWKSNKITTTLSVLLKEKVAAEVNLPLLVFTDKVVVNEKLEELSCSFFEFQGLNPTKTSLNQLLVQNITSGCTMMINQPLAKLSLVESSDGIVMHDHWITLVASVFGKILFCSDKTILYRQHSRNVLGANKYGSSFLLQKLLSGRKELKNRFYSNVKQAQKFLHEYDNVLPVEYKALLIAFAGMESYSSIKRFSTIIKFSFFKHKFLRNIGMFYILF